MKYVIFSDVHGKSLKPLEKKLEHYGRRSNLRLICMSDFDDADVIKQARDLIESYNGIIVPGNHDEMLYRKFVDFDSGTFGNGQNAFGYALKLHKDKEALDYLASILYGNNAKSLISALRQQSRLIPIVGEQSQNSGLQLANAIVVHGGLDGSLCSSDYIDLGIERLWYRIYVNELWQKHAQQNFLKMDEMGCNIMIRGHDHIQAYAYKRENGEISIKCQRGKVYNLLPRRMHIINPGAYFKGDYAIINTESLFPELSFHNLGEND